MSKFIKMFFAEKQLSERVYEIQNGTTLHFIESGFVIDLIKKLHKDEQKKIELTLRKIDFMNGDVHHFLEHLAKAYVEIHYAEAI